MIINGAKKCQYGNIIRVRLHYMLLLATKISFIYYKLPIFLSLGTCYIGEQIIENILPYFKYP